MAITWPCVISNANPDTFRADVSFKRVDDNLANPTEENYSFSKAVLETQEQRIALLDLVWNEHLKAVAKQTAIDNFITNLETQAKENLEAREL